MSQSVQQASQTTASGLPLPAVDGVWRRWEPRFIAAGADFNIVTRLKTSITDWSQWSAAWSAEADKVEEAGAEAFDTGRHLTAGQLWALASLLHHFGGMYFIHDQERFHQAHASAVALMRQAAPLLSPAAREIRGTNGDQEFVGYLQVPPSATPPPVVVLFNGFEGTKEESQQRVAELHERGLATLCWDGPGRGEAWARTPMTADYGPATSLMIDALEREPSVDATRVGGIGPNRGGFFAIKAAAHEPRLRALAVTSPGYDRRGVDWQSPYQEAFFSHLFHVDSPEALLARANGDDFTLSPKETAAISAPCLIVAGDRDEGYHYEGSKRLYAELPGDKHWAVIKGSERNGNNVPYVIRPMMADFLAERLGA